MNSIINKLLWNIFREKNLFPVEIESTRDCVKETSPIYQHGTPRVGTYLISIIWLGTNTCYDFR